MLSVRVKSYAKVNLSLNISGVREGWHALDTVVASVNICDVIRARARKDKLVNVYMRGCGSEGIPPERNNAVRAGEAFVSAFGTGGADIEIDKDIPMGAGLGGSSADAAGVLNALAKLYKVEDFAALKALADGLGSDTGYMLRGGFARLSGRGTRVEPLVSPRRYDMLLFLPGTPVRCARTARGWLRLCGRATLRAWRPTCTTRSGGPRARSTATSPRRWLRRPPFRPPPAR